MLGFSCETEFYIFDPLQHGLGKIDRRRQILVHSL